MIRLRQLGPAFIHHVEAYGLLVAAAGRELRTQGRRRVAMAAGGAVLAIAFVILAGGTAIAAAWDTQGRWWVVLAVLGLFAAGAAACLAAAFAALPRSSHLAALREEWRKDKAWLSSRHSAAVTDVPSVRETVTPAVLGAPGRLRGS